MENKILKTYIPYKTSLRKVAQICNTNHHNVKRILIKNNIEIVRAKRIFTKEHKKNISIACKGRISPNKGKKASKKQLYKNMSNHLRFDVSWEWLFKFKEIEKLKILNRAISRGNRFNFNSYEYTQYILKFYYDNQFNRVYYNWLNSGKDKYKIPSIDHIIPKSKGGTNKLENLQFLTWFENRCKNNMSIKAWSLMKDHIFEYFIGE